MYQILLLVAGRWFVGWIFPARDLEILDDPIPEKLYCGRNGKNSHNCCYNGGKEYNEDPEKGLEIKEQTDGAQENGINDEKKCKDGSLNITHEVNKCDLWKHMVHSLDKEPSSTGKTKNEGGAKTNLMTKFEEAEENEEPLLVSYKPLMKSTEV